MDDELLILTESPSVNYRGVYIFRVGDSQPIAIAVPQPKSEPGTLPIGVSLFRNQHARVLLISGVSKRKEFAEFDVTHLSNKRSLFQLVHQVVQREFAASDPILSIQVRGAADLIDPDVDVIISNGREYRSGSAASPRLEQFQDNLERFGLNSRFFRSDETDMHLSSHSNAQQAYVETFNMGEFAVAWFDSSFRRSFKPIDLDDRLIEALGWSNLSVISANGYSLL